MNSAAQRYRGGKIRGLRKAVVPIYSFYKWIFDWWMLQRHKIIKMCWYKLIKFSKRLGTATWVGWEELWLIKRHLYKIVNCSLNSRPLLQLFSYSSNPVQNSVFQTYSLGIRLGSGYGKQEIKVYILHVNTLSCFLRLMRLNQRISISRVCSWHSR